MKFIYLFILLQTNLFATTKHYFVFYKIDNKVKVYVNEKLIYESGLIDANPDFKLRVDMEEHIEKGKNTIRLELYNGSTHSFAIEDTHWEISFELFENDDPIEYRHEKSDNGKVGLAYEWNYIIQK